MCITTMIAYDQILIPTDGSETSQRATEHAVSMAARQDATLHALHVVDGGPDSAPDVGGGLNAADLRERGEESIEAVRERAERAGVEVETVVDAGVAYQSIVEYVDTNDIDLVVMGTHGRSGIQRFLLGSVAERVIRTVNAPVMTVKTNFSSEESPPAR